MLLPVPVLVTADRASFVHLHTGEAKSATPGPVVGAVYNLSDVVIHVRGGRRVEGVEVGHDEILDLTAH